MVSSCHASFILFFLLSIHKPQRRTRHVFAVVSYFADVAAEDIGAGHKGDSFPGDGRIVPGREPESLCAGLVTGLLDRGPRRKPCAVPLDGLPALHPGDCRKPDPEQNEEQEGSDKKTASLRTLAFVLICHASAEPFRRDFFRQEYMQFFDRNHRFVQRLFQRRHPVPLRSTNRNAIRIKRPLAHKMLHVHGRANGRLIAREESP